MPKLVVAAVQLKNRPGNKAESYAAAEHFLEQAKRGGAQLAVLPELSCCGYIPNQDIWRHAEGCDGPSPRWAAALAKKLGMFIGAGFAEYDGDYYNSYLIANPQGGIDGFVRKANPESYCFRGHSGENLVSTALGKLGVGICADNHSYKFLIKMQTAEPDLMLMPHGWPMPCRTGGAVSQKDIDEAKSNAFSLTKVYAQQLGVPIVFANSVGEFPPMSGILGRFMSPGAFALGGHTHITDWDGTLRGTIPREEGCIISEVSMRAVREPAPPPPRYGDWLHPGSAIVRNLVLPLDQAFGRRAYQRSKTKKQ